MEDWRLITLLCCGYKLISGIVAGRIEKYLKKNIGRGQKGFLNFKNISSCTVNIIDNISQSWSAGEKMGVLCVDFSKAFDSVEHTFIDNTLEFFNLLLLSFIYSHRQPIIYNFFLKPNHNHTNSYILVLQ